MTCDSKTNLLVFRSQMAFILNTYTANALKHNGGKTEKLDFLIYPVQSRFRINS